MKETQSYKFKMDGADAEKKVLYIESEDGKEKLWVLDDALPLIMKMAIGFTITLEEVITEKQVSDLASLIGKNLQSSPETKELWNRVKKSSWEEITDMSDEEGGSIVHEYYCPIEGLRLTAINDTLTTIYCYAQGTVNVDFTFDQTELKLPYGLTTTMTRKDVEQKFGKPGEDQKNRVYYPWSIEYPDKKVNIYYQYEDENAPQTPHDKIAMLIIK
jgi:hypothetical protein